VNWPKGHDNCAITGVKGRSHPVLELGWSWAATKRPLAIAWILRIVKKKEIACYIIVLMPSELVLQLPKLSRNWPKGPWQLAQLTGRKVPFHPVLELGLELDLSHLPSATEIALNLCYCQRRKRCMLLNSWWCQSELVLQVAPSLVELTRGPWQLAQITGVNAVTIQCWGLGLSCPLPSATAIALNCVIV